MLKRAFLAYVLVELAVLVGLTWAVGLGWTLLVLLSTAVVGFAMAGSQARRQLMRLQEFQATARCQSPRCGRRQRHDRDGHRSGVHSRSGEFPDRLPDVASADAQCDPAGGGVLLNRGLLAPPAGSRS